jgi:hypothetical protein
MVRMVCGGLNKSLAENSAKEASKRGGEANLTKRRGFARTRTNAPGKHACPEGE